MGIRWFNTIFYNGEHIGLKGYTWPLYPFDPNEMPSMEMNEQIMIIDDASNGMGDCYLYTIPWRRDEVENNIISLIPEARPVWSSPMTLKLPEVTYNKKTGRVIRLDGKFLEDFHKEVVKERSTKGLKLIINPNLIKRESGNIT